MAHLVKCKYCGKTFDRDVEPCVKVSAKRYAHKACAEKYEQERPQEDRDLEALNKYIMQLFNESYVNARTQRQIKEYKEKYHYTYSGMLKSLIYWYDIKGNSTDQANGGVGILPYIYAEAYDYYYKIYLAQSANKDKDINNYTNPQIKIIDIPPPSAREKPRKLFFEGEDEWENM